MNKMDSWIRYSLKGVKKKLEKLGASRKTIDEILEHEGAHHKKALELGHSTYFILRAEKLSRRRYFAYQCSTIVMGNVRPKDMALIAQAAGEDMSSEDKCLAGFGKDLWDT